MIRYAANVSIAFKEHPFYERFQRAADLGFGAVEFMSPFPYDVDDVARAIRSAGVQVVQFNVADGNIGGGARGFASHPQRRQEWRDEMLRGIDLAVKLGARQINSLVGCVIPGMDRELQINYLVDNLQWADQHLAAAKLPLMIEALNLHDNPGYLLQYSREVIDVMDRAESEWVMFQYDVYHMQRVEGDLVRRIREYLPRIGHIQIADNPGRHQPGTGEINYRFVLGALEEAGYDRYVGLEYGPLTTTEASFDWLPRDKRVASTAADLRL